MSSFPARRGEQEPGFRPGTVEPTREAEDAGPRLGLALGGGSARGWAHIGAIRALDEAGIPVHVVAGCSIGAVVGACHAAGKLDALAAFALSLTRRRVVGLLDPCLSGASLIGGDRLRRRLAADLGTRDATDLPLRFAAVATELGTGHEVWLSRGPLVEVLRASYALPGILPPVPLDGRLLMDGTLVNPVPVSLARSLGADVVVCVNLGCGPRARGRPIEPAPPDPAAEAVSGTVEARRRWSLLGTVRGGLRRVPRESGPGLARVVFEAFNITQDRLSRARLERDPPDVTITPALADMGLFEFHRAEEGIARGHAAARAALPRIRAALAGAAART